MASVITPRSPRSNRPPQDLTRITQIVLPSAIRTVAPFLEEAQTILRRHGEHSIQRTALFCIDHALRLVKAFTLTLDEESEAVLTAFRTRRDEIAAGCGMTPYADDGLYNTDIVGTAADGSMTAEDILIAEATTTLALADQQYDEGDHDAAAKNFHTATIYFRVLESMVPRLTPRVHAYLIYAAYRTQVRLWVCERCVGQLAAPTASLSPFPPVPFSPSPFLPSQESSTVIENLVHEHFDGTRCVDLYEIVENKRLGKVRQRTGCGGVCGM